MIPGPKYPLLISVPVSPFCELAKWALDRLGVEYYEECHAPVLHALFNKLHGGGNEIPVLVLPTGPLVNGREIVLHYDRRAPEPLRLFPEGPAQEQVRTLFDLFCSELGVAVRAWAYAYMLHDRASTIPMWIHRVGFLERIFVKAAYPLLAFLLGRALAIDDETIIRERGRMLRIFDQVEELLRDGRKYLTGDTFTAADLAFAVMAAPAVLPPEYDCPMPALGNLSFALRAEVEQFRQRPAGQFLLDIFRMRPKRKRILTTDRKQSRWQDVKNLVLNAMLSPRVLRPIFSFLRRFKPVVRIGRSYLLTKDADVANALSTPNIFVVGPTNGRNFSAVDNPFVLGMDPGEQYTRELGLLRETVLMEDFARIRDASRSIVGDLLAVPRPSGKIEMVNELVRPLAARICAYYFGVSGPDEQTFLRWMRLIFRAVLANPGNDAVVQATGKIAAAEAHEHLKLLIWQKRQGADGDDVLARMIRLQPRYAWLDDFTISRNIGGLMVGTIETTVKFTTLCVQELLRNKPALDAARTAAVSGDLESLWGAIMETVRFNPAIPFLLRDVASEVSLSEDCITFQRGARVYLALGSAMFDESAFPEPLKFKLRPAAPYRHFGGGMHYCFGREFARVMISETIHALLLRQSFTSMDSIVYDGPFPDQFVLNIGVGHPAVGNGKHD
jgi:cytochrome P450/glutathione S-transferase